MSISSILTNVSLVIVDNRKELAIFCKDHKKQLKTYRIARWHFKAHHNLTPKQFEKISKIARLLK